jgi:outer membrane protein assembly factor BamD
MCTVRFARPLLAVVALGLGACRSAPPYQGMDAQELYAHALQAFEREDWDEASQAFERVLITYPAFPQRIEARLYLARSFYEKKEYITAEAEFRRLLMTAPGHQLAPAASLGICQAYAGLSPKPQRDQSYTEQAVRACETTAADYAGTPEAGQARLMRHEMLEKLAEKDFLRAEFYYRRNLIDSALLYFRLVSEEYPDTSWAPEALLRIYEGNLRIGYDTEAEDARADLLTKYPDSPAAQSLSNGA